MTKTEQLAEIEGVSVEEMLQFACTDSVVPGICKNPGCDVTAHYEPDQDEGWCERCRDYSVVSCLVLEGLI